MRYGTNTNLSSLLDQKVDILQLMHDEDSTAYAWTIRKTCPAYVETDIHDNLFSAAGAAAALRPVRERAVLRSPFARTAGSHCTKPCAGTANSCF